MFVFRKEHSCHSWEEFSKTVVGYRRNCLMGGKVIDNVYAQ